MTKPATHTRPVADETLEMNPDALEPDLEVASLPSPVTVHRTHRRPLGAHPVPLLGGAGSVALLVAIVLLAAGSAIAGFLVLVFAAALPGLAGGVRREPDAPAAKPMLSASGHCASTGGVWHRERPRMDPRRLEARS